MKIDRIKWNMAGFRALRKSGEVHADLARRAASIADAAGEGYEARSGQGRSRARASVVTTTKKAMKRPNRILENLDRGRG